MLTFVLFCIGIGLLVWGSDALVRGASNLAYLIRLSPLVVGLTVVALGTSSPELAVSLTSTFAGQDGIAVGNVVGSNLCNILLILGIAGVVTPLAVKRRVLVFDVPVMIGAALAIVLFSIDGRINAYEGGVLVLAAAAYTAVSIRQARAAHDAREDFPEIPRAHGMGLNLVLIIAGLSVLVLGAHWMVEGAVAFARILGLSETVIGLTVVAAGTSLPEVATSVAASRRNAGDIAIGNVVGSNILNVFVILGVCAVVSGSRGIAVSEEIRNLDAPLALLASLACVPLFWSGGRLARSEAALLLAGYILYIWWCLAGTAGESSRLTVKWAAALYGAVFVMAVAASFLRKRRTVVLTEKAED